MKLLEEHKDKVILPLDRIGESENHFWVFGIVLKQEGIRDQVMESMFERNIETRPFFWPLHLQKYINNQNKFPASSLPVSEKIGKDGLYIPIGSHINKSKQKKIIHNFVEIINSY